VARRGYGTRRRPGVTVRAKRVAVATTALVAVSTTIIGVLVTSEGHATGHTDLAAPSAARHRGQTGVPPTTARRQRLTSLPSTVPSVTTTALPLAGKVVAIDPGHNGGNAAASTQINQLVNAGGFTKACDTTGTETNGGYPEYEFNLNVAIETAALLRVAGAHVILTRTTSTGIGPCVTERAAIGNLAHADAAISIHADGGPESGRGFQVIEPLPVVSSISNNSAIIGPSDNLALDVRAAFAPATDMPYANYIGSDGLSRRNDLGGLNLSVVPKVFIECGNMRNATDAALLTSPAWQERAAQGIAQGIETFLERSR